MFFGRSILIAASVMSAASGSLYAQHSSVLMISIDGMRPDYITQADEHHLLIPTLRGLMHDGAHAEGVTGVFPTVTYPSHTTLVTGVWPAKHGIVNNQRFDPERNLAGAWYWYADAIRVPTLWSVAHAAGESTASVGWPVTVGAKDIDYLIPEYWRGNLGDQFNPDDRYLINVISRPFNEVEKIAQTTGVPYMKGNETTIDGDEIKTVYALDILRQHHPKLMTIHLSSLDEEEHLHGPFSAEANADLEHLDGMVARLVTQERSNDPSADIVIVSDHGFADIDHMVRLSVPFIAAGLMPGPNAKPNELANWQAQPWPLGGMFAIMLRHSEDAALKTKVRELLERVAADPQNGVEAILDQAQVANRGGDPAASFVVTLRKGFVPTADLSGSLVAGIPGHRGTHGYDPSTTPEMRSSFFIAGPNIAQGKDLGIIDMRSIAPTVAQILGISLGATDAPMLNLL